MHTRWLNAMIIAVMLLGMLPFSAQAAPLETAPETTGGGDEPPTVMVDPGLKELAPDEETGYLIYLREEPDLSAAYDMDWDARGRYVVKQLQATAERSQADVRAYLDAQGVAYQAFWIDNVIVVESSSVNTMNQLTTFPEIDALLERRQPILYEPEDISPAAILMGIEPNISHVNADEVWGLGYTGDGMVVANIDTGVRYTHDALVDQYRGNQGGGSFDHNYNWWDPYLGTTEPSDFHNHGSHTMGTMVGDDGGDNQIGMAPDAQWIACKSFEGGSVDAQLLECGQFMAAPWDLNGDNANPDLRPNVVNNSWGDCMQSYDPWYEGVLGSWHAAGIYPVFSNGNASNCGYPQPPGLNTVGNPARSGDVTGVGSTGTSNGQYATYSNWGPTDNPDTINPRGYPYLKPQVAAPGTNRSAYGTGNDSSYGGMSGTSMAAPHVAGLVALIWSAAPCLVGDYATTETVIEETAIPIPYDTGNGDEGPGNVPNHATGWGEINALAAVDAAAAMCGDSAIVGQVTDADTSDPIAGADILATSATEERKTTSDVDGFYVLNVFSDTYDLAATAFGYAPALIPDVVATTGMTTTQNISMEAAEWHTVSGAVTDATTGWPLYASLDFPGYPVDQVWTNPVDGSYSVQLPEGITFTFEVNAWTPGYQTADRVVGPLTADATEDFALEANLDVCGAPGYEWSNGLIEEFETSFPPDGWTVVNNGGDCTWVGDDPGGRGNLTGATGKFAIADSDACGPGTTMDTDLLSPIMDVSGMAAVILEFAYDYRHLGSGSALVDISADGGDTWTNLATWTASQRGPATFSQDVTSLVGSSTEAQVRFRFLAPGWLWWWQVDRFVLGDPLCNPPADGGLVVGNAYDANYPLVALNDAEVINEAGYAAETAPTPDDGAVDDGFYTLFSPSGTQVFTATAMGYGADVVDVTVVDGDTVAQDFLLPAGLLSAAPEGLDVTVDLGYTDTRTLDLLNTGDVAAEFAFVERAGQIYPLSIPAFTGELPQKDKGTLSTGLAPQSEQGEGLRAATDAFPIEVAPPAFAIEVFPGSDLVYIPDTTDPGTWDVVGGVTLGGAFAGDFLGGAFGQMYVLDSSNKLYLVETATGAAMEIGDSAPAGGQSWTGMTGSVDGTLYASSTDCGGTSMLYAVDPGTGTPTEIGPITDGPCIIDIAINAEGEMYGVDIVNDELVQIDPETGAGTVVGSTGFAANFAQGLDFEEESGVLYWAAYGASGELRVIDTTTGASAHIGAFPGGAEVDCLAFPTGGVADVPWLSEEPITGTVSAAGDTSITVDFDAAYVDQPGEYHAELIVKNDTPYGKFNIPVTMTVTGPASWGKLMGTVTGLGVCDDDPAPLEEAEVHVESATTGHTWTVTTDISGTYHLWLDQAHSPLTVTVSAPDYYDQEGGVEVTQGETTVLDFDLRLLQPCLSYDPADFDVTLPMGDNLVETLTLSNTGAAEAEFELLEIPGDFMPQAVMSLSPSAIPTREPLPSYDPDATTTDNILSPGSTPPLGILAAGDVLAQWGTGMVLPWGAGFNLGDQMVWLNDNAAGGGSGLNEEFDVAGNRTGASFTPNFGGSWPGDMAYNPNTGMFWQVNVGGDNCIYEWDPSIPAATGNSICGAAWTATSQRGLAYDPTDDTFFIGGWNDTDVYHIDNTGAVIEQWTLNLGVSGLAYNFDAGYLFIIENSTTDTISVFDVASGSIVDTFTVTGFGSYSAAGLAIDCDGNLWAPNMNDFNAYLIDSGVPADLCAGGPGGGIPWVSEDPITGTIATDDDAMVDLTFDAGVPETMQPGTYYGELKVDSNAANDVANVPLTLTVTPPDDWGKLMGEVTGLGYCDTVTPTLLEDAEITVESGAGAIAWDLTTDVSGTYQLWLDAAHNPLTVTVEHPDHATEVFTDVMVTAGGTTVLDAALRWAQPCLTVDPDLFDVTVTLGMSTTVPFSLTNWGAAGASFDLVEANGGILPMATTSIASTVPEHVVTIGDGSILMHNPRVDLTPSPAEAPYRPLGTQTLTHSASQTVMGGNSVHCGSGGIHADNSYLRTFHLPDFGIDVDFSVINVEVGIETASNGPQPATLNLYTLDGALTWANLTLIGSANVSIADQDLTVYNIPVTADVPAGSTLVVELFTPDGTGGSYTFFVGSNNLGQTAPTYLAADACGISEPTDTADIGFPGMHMVMNVTGSPIELQSIPWLSEDPESGAVNADSTFLVDLTFDASDAVTQVTQPGEYFGTLFVNSDDPFNDNIPVPVTMTVEPPATWGKLMGTVQSLGYCDAAPAPVADQEVLIEGSGGMTWTVTTDVSGTYQLWLDEMYSPLTVTVAATDHETGTVTGVTVISGTTTTQNLDLRWLEPCVEADPLALHATLELGATATEALTLTNTGAVSTAWDLAEENLGAPTVTPPGYTYYLDEDFEGAFPPTGWYVTDTIGSGNMWFQSATNYTNGSGNSAAADSDAYCGSGAWDTELWSPPIDFSGTMAPELNYQSNFQDYAGAGEAWLDISTDGGTNWTNLSYWTNDYGPTFETVDLSAYVSEVIILRWRYSDNGDGCAWYWHIDDVIVQDVDPVTWLSETPASGNLVADTGEQVVDVDFDASVTGIDQPGDYLANLWVNSDDPTAPAILPVTMTVTPPATWGELLGVVSSLGYCDAEMNPLEGAEVVIWDSAAPVVTLTTDISGTYSYWLPADAYTVTFSAPDHATEVITDVIVTASATTTQDASLTWLGPCVTDITPSSMEVTLAMGMSETLPLTMTNAGAGALNFEFVEMNGGFTPMLMMAVQQAIQASTVVWNAEKLAGECAVYQDSILAEPAAARECYDFVPAPQTFTMQPLAPTDSGYAQDIGYISDNFVTFALNDFPGQTVLGTSTDAYYGMDFDPTATTLYALNDDTGELGTIDLTDGTFTALAPCTAPSGNWTGLTIDPVAGTFYASDATNLYTIDPATGASTLVGAFGGGSSLMIDIAMNAAGEMYGHDIGTDSIYQIDPATGAATLVGSTGYDANYAQGMDFDNDDGTLYIFLYQGGGANVYGTVDLTTGAVTPLAVSDPQGEFEGAVQTAGFVSIPWLFEDPESGTVPLTVTGGADITFDAGVPEVTQPGDYFGELQINNNDPVWDEFTLPVTMHVTLPATYGQITGTVAGLGPCDDPLTAEPLEGADVLVASATQTWTLTTDADGAYAIWLDEAHSPVTITVDAMDYVSDTVTGVTVISGTTTPAPDIALRPLAPCATVTPLMIEESLTLGMSTTVPITIGNTGAYTLAWSLSDDGVMWMDQDPTAGETSADGGTSAVTVTLDTADFDQPGTYTATLFVDNDSINDPLSIPVTLTVEAPATWGKLEGLVQGLGYCDAMTMPLEGAHVLIQSWMTETVSTTIALFQEDFEGTFPPAGWTVVDNAGTGNVWNRNDFFGAPNRTINGGGSGYSADADSDATCGGGAWDTELWSPPIDLMGVTSPVLSFASNFQDFAGNGQAWLDVSTDGGVTWPDNLYYQTTDDAGGTTGGGVAREVDLSAYTGQTIMLRWRYSDDGGGCEWFWQIDAVRITYDYAGPQPVNWQLTTDVSGTYGLWLDEMYSPLTVTISYEAGYGEQVFTAVDIVSGAVTTLDANLHWLQPCLTPTPDALELNVPMGTTTTAEINLANMGAFTGSFMLSEWSLGFDMLGIMAAGGPDGFGYRFADSNEAGISPVYDFVDISGIGTPLALGDNDNTEVDIGFDFKFYGADALDPNLYDTVFVGSNGFLSFGAGSDDLNPDPALPDPTLPNNLIAAAWDDLVPGTVYVQSFDQCPYNPDPNTVDACFIVQYDDFSHAGGASAGAWEVILFRSGSILMQYAEVDAPDATTGIENQFGSAGLNYGPTLADDLAICFAYPGEWLDCQTTQVPWLETDVDEGDIAAYDDLTVTVTLDAGVTEIAVPGDYLAELVIDSDDPENPFQIIPVTMTVDMPATMARLSGDIYGWGYCDAISETLPGADITLQTEHGDHHVLTPDVDGAYAVWIEAGQITMTVEHEGYLSVTLTDTLDPGFAPQQDMHLHLDAPCASMSYDEAFDVVVVQGERVTRSLMLHNGGAGSLTYDNILATGLWLSVDPVTGTVAPYGAQPVNVVFDATGLDVGVYQSNMEIAHNDLQASRMFVRPIQMTVVADGTILMPTMDAKEGNPGETVTYMMTVTNHADTAVTFDVLASGHVWTTTVPATVTVAASDTATFTVDVDIPIDAHTGYSDTVAIDVESQGTDEQQASALLQTTVAEQPVVLSLTKTADPADYVMPGDTITYTIDLVNDGNDPLTIVLTDTIPDDTTYVLESITGGAELIDPPGDHIAWSGVLDKGAEHTISFQVMVDEDIANGTVITNTVNVNANGEAYAESATVAAYAFTLDVAVEGEGTVQVEPEQDVYRLNQPVTLTATADPDWTFTGWSGDVVTATNPLGIIIMENTVVTATFEFTNQAPIFTSTPITTADVGATYNYTVTTEDPDGDTLTITMATGPAWLTLTDNGDGAALLAGTPISAGAFPVELSVTDGLAQDTQDFSILVTSNKIFLPLVLRQ